MVRSKSFVSISNDEIYKKIETIENDLQITHAKVLDVLGHIERKMAIHDTKDRGMFRNINWFLGLLFTWLASLSGYLVMVMIK